MNNNYTSAFSFYTLLFLLTTFLSCQNKSQAQNTVPSVSGFASIPVATKILPGVIDEASGIADSKANAGYLWVEQDSGNPNDLFLLSYGGEIFKKVNIKPATNRDWEDLASGNGPTDGINYLYIAETGDNSQVLPEYIVYRFPEPATAADTVYEIDKISFQYPDGSHDAEAILIDNDSKDIYIITKRDAVSAIYKLSYPQSVTTLNTAIYAGSLSFSGVVSAAASASGGELLIKTYTSLYYWKKSGSEKIEQALSKTPVKLDYQNEPQGEAVCFKNDGKGFYTLSERPPYSTFVNLNFYKRK